MDDVQTCPTASTDVYVHLIIAIPGCLQAGSIAELLVKEGFAKCVDWTMKVVMEGRERLRAAEKEAKEKKKRIWKVSCVSPPAPSL